MSDRTSEIQAATKEFVLREFLPGESPDALTTSTPLISGGVLDSISTVKLVGFLEDTYDVEFAAHEVSEDHLDTLEKLSALVQSKLAAG